tara:strand:+ start:590 stop:697 length:108 start_codon:yes stop_codon:yes gene_type:complete
MRTEEKSKKENTVGTREMIWSNLYAVNLREASEMA